MTETWVFLIGPLKFLHGSDGISWPNVRVTAKSVHERRLKILVLRSMGPLFLNGRIRPVRIPGALAE
jgi:hypothetical protein